MKVEIAGAGLMGRLIGWRLAERGAAVTLFERAARSQPESAAHAAAAMLAPVSEYPDADPAIFEMGKRSLELWPPLLDALNVPYGMDGSLLVAHGPDGPLLDKFHRSLGACATSEARWLDADDIGALEPALAGRFQRGLLLPNEGWLDNRGLLDALESRCGDIRYEHPVEPCNPARIRHQLPAADADALARRGLLQRRNVDALATKVGDGCGLEADVAIDCRGTGAVLPGLRGVRGEAIRVHASEVQLSRPVRLMHPRYQLYAAPRPGGEYVIGATQIESDSERGVTVRSALELLSAAFALHAGFAEAEILELCTGLRPAFPDNLPRVEWDDGVLRVNGLYRHGFLIAPALVEHVIAEIDQIPCTQTAVAR